MRSSAILAAARIGLAGLGLALCLPHAARAQAVLRGTVIENGSGRPVPHALIEVVDGIRRVASAVSDSSGAFQLNSTVTGDAVLVVSRIGYKPVRQGVRLSTRATTVQTVTLQPEAVALDAINVPVESGVLEDRLKGYVRRRQLGAGYFLSEERLRDAGSVPLSELLRSVPGIEVSNRKTPYGPQVFTNSNEIQNQISPFRRGVVPNSQMSIGPCPMQLYIDGRHFSTQDLGIDIIRPEDLVGVEIFRSVAELPAEFGGLHARCGVVSVWTRRVPR